MLKKRRWHNHPRWYLLMVVPLMIWTVTDDSRISRSLGVVSLFCWGIQYQRAMSQWRRTDGATGSLRGAVWGPSDVDNR
ncbi:hypothetical protein ACWEQ2_21935 [Streptomyces sp. NPDC004096]|uniref:hypothetical protein n=1 Tax=Streptomyces sp. NPDC057746 TaxID=3346237 RepID=UPI00369EBFB7